MIFITVSVFSSLLTGTRSSSSTSNKPKPRPPALLVRAEPGEDTHTPPSTPSTPTTIRRFFKKATKEDGMDRVLETVNFEEKFSSLPEFRPIAAAAAVPSSPQAGLVASLHHSYSIQIQQ